MSSFYHGNTMACDPFEEYVKDSLQVVERILAANRNPPRLASSQHDHKYDDKFLLSQLMTNVGLTAICNAIDAMDGTGGSLKKTVSKASEQNKSITLRFLAKEKCEFLKEEEKDVESPMSIEETKEESDDKGGVKKLFSKRKVFNKVKLFHWKATIEYDIYLFIGNDSGVDCETTQVLHRNTITAQLTQQGFKQNPLGKGVFFHEPIDLNLTWLLHNMNKEDSSVEFCIDRSLESCRTPRFNKETIKAEEFFGLMMNWADHLRSFFIQKELFFVQHDEHNGQRDNVEVTLAEISGKEVFVPVLPLFEQIDKDDANSESKSEVMLSNHDIELLLNEQINSLKHALENLKSQFAYRYEGKSDETNTSPICLQDATAVLVSVHIVDITKYYTASICHIEKMLMQQLYDAIGKIINVSDLDEFVRFHNKRFFNETYAAEDFCYAIRRKKNYPDGLLSIEEKKGDRDNNAITFTRRLSQRPMYIPINSATSVKFEGDIYAHAWMLQRYMKSPLSFNIIARARQFSSFCLVLGKISGSDEFLPESAIILQNKDEINIPLLFDEMPSAKEFKDAIESLSPEQQAFARAFRGMKLSSSVFGVGVIQIKPQLEVLLDLPDESLIKEVELTQDLMKLFVDYQIPSDLLSYDGDIDASPSEKVGKVKEHVGHIKDMIEKEKASDLEDAKQKAQMGLFGKGKVHIDDLNAMHESQQLPHPYPTANKNAGLFGAPPTTCNNHFSMRSHEATEANVMAVGMALCCSSSLGSAPAPAAPGPSVVDRGGGSNNTKRYNADEDSSTDLSKNAKHVQVLDLDSGLSDFSVIPKTLDAAFEKYAENEVHGGSIRNVTLKSSPMWTKKSKSNLLKPMETKRVSLDEQKTERDKAYDLLDALSKSGALEIRSGELHMIVASCHSFEKSLVNTIIQDNINPIEKIEKSNLISASIIHGVPFPELQLQNNRNASSKRLKVSDETEDDM